jgi:signal transduction histidine kinase
VAAGIVTLLVTSRALVPIRRSFDAQRRFVADASHELRTPVALIRANAEVLQREGLLEVGGEPLAEDIVAEADRMGRLVGDLLTLASADSRDLPLDIAVVDLAEVARETARNVGAHAAIRGISIAVEVEGAGPVSVLADRDRMTQLVLILVDNAIAHSPDGGPIRIGVATDGHRAVLVVSDQGPGVPAADRERIFEPFTRLSGRRASGQPGSGLGLAIGSRIAAAHGGSISVDDAPGGGARFTVTMPAGHGSH